MTRPQSRDTQESDVFDPIFYRTYYADLAGLSEKQAHRHYKTIGRQEGRKPNEKSVLHDLQARYGPLPSDFDADMYGSLNPSIAVDFKIQIHAAEHYLAVGRSENRPYTIAGRQVQERQILRDLRSRLPEQLVYRSWIEERNAALKKVFGEHLIDRTILRAVIAASNLVASNPSVAAPLLEDIVIARYLLSAQGAYEADFRSHLTQLSALFFTLFACPSLPRRSVELELVNRLVDRAVEMSIAGGDGGLPPLTLFILAARASLCGVNSHSDLRNPDRAVTEFFTKDVIDLKLQRFVTAQQRKRLREHNPEGVPLALALLRASKARAVEIDAMPSDPSAAGDWFISEGPWTLGMHYVLSGPQVAASQIKVDIDADGLVALDLPAFLFEEDRAPLKKMSVDEVQHWLRESGIIRLRALGISEYMLGRSAAAFLSAAPQREPEMHALEQSTHVRGGFEINSIRPGHLLVFGVEGNGPHYLIGRGWHGSEGEHTWMAGPTAQLAFALEAAADSSLDLFLDVATSDHHRDLRFGVLWNGEAVSEFGPESLQESWIQIYLGARHRPPCDLNILTLWVNRTSRPSDHGSHDDRILGMSLRRMMLVCR
jgi:hypothetical protein